MVNLYMFNVDNWLWRLHVLNYVVELLRANEGDLGYYIHAFTNNITIKIRMPPTINIQHVQQRQNRNTFVTNHSSNNHHQKQTHPIIIIKLHIIIQQHNSIHAITTSNYQH